MPTYVPVHTLGLRTHLAVLFRALAACGIFAVACLLARAAGASIFAAECGLQRAYSPGQHSTTTLHIVRHGDKMSKYPPCAAKGLVQSGEPCFDEARFGNNPELSECGRRQARLLATRLAADLTNSTAIWSSPYARTLQTALPLARKLGKTIKVEALFSEDRQLNGPFQPRHAEPSESGAQDWLRIARVWDRYYSSPPIPTPEGNAEYWERVQQAADKLVLQLRGVGAAAAPPPESAVVFSHAGPSFSLAYGLCRRKFGDSLRRFVDTYVAADGLPGLAPAGMIRIELNDSGECTRIELPDNQVWQEAACGETKPHRKNFDADPGKYWRPPADLTTVAVDRSGD
mmetsp:Transcript_6487/g.15005  ORF Transcript_6487/g.15005 Transcript_6487/m.15005 type:complete len:344 (-) Transcript_6487:111-1142(-)